jgi:sigma-E factor negative regulatory protein RseC
MQEEVGTVLKAGGGVAKVLVKRNAACDHCPSRSCCASLGGDLKRVDVSNIIGAKEGQQVKIGISPKTILKVSFILYMIPILALIIGAMFGGHLGAQHKEIWAITFRETIKSTEEDCKWKNGLSFWELWGCSSF